MLVSVVVPAYNQADYLSETLKSALTQTYRDLEIIVVDDGSEDHTAKICASFEEARLRYFYQKNDGTYGLGARNRAMLEARGDWVALLDQDDLWHPEKIDLQLKLAEERKVGCVSCLTRFIDAHGKVIGHQDNNLPEGDVYAALLRRNRYYASSGIFRRTLLAVAGIPHESAGYADWQLWMSLARHTTFGVVPQHLVDYRIQPDSYQQASKQFDFAQDNWQTLRAHECRIPPNRTDCVSNLRVGMRVNRQLFIRAAETAAKEGDIEGCVNAWSRAFYSSYTRMPTMLPLPYIGRLIFLVLKHWMNRFVSSQAK